jgi:transcriptional regulator with XRE-family HTH domain
MTEPRPEVEMANAVRDSIERLERSLAESLAWLADARVVTGYRDAMNALASIRHRKGWTQRQLAEAVGVSPGTMSMREGFQRMAPGDEFFAQVHALGLRVAFLPDTGPSRTGEDGRSTAVPDWAPCGATYDNQPPCRKPAGHENGPDTDWKRDLHSNGQFKWPVELTGEGQRPRNGGSASDPTGTATR